MGQIYDGFSCAPKFGDLGEDEDPVFACDFRLIGVIADDLSGLDGLKIVRAHAIGEAKSAGAQPYGVHQRVSLERMPFRLELSRRSVRSVFDRSLHWRSFDPASEIIEDFVIDLLYATGIVGLTRFVADAGATTAVQVLVEGTRFSCEHAVWICQENVGMKVRQVCTAPGRHEQERFRRLEGGMQVEADVGVTQGLCQFTGSFLFVQPSPSIEHLFSEAAIEIDAFVRESCALSCGERVADGEGEYSATHLESTCLEGAQQAFYDVDTRLLVAVDSAHDREMQAGVEILSMDRPDSIRNLGDVCLVVHDVHLRILGIRKPLLDVRRGFAEIRRTGRTSIQPILTEKG